MAISFDLARHDAQFHPEGFVEGKSRCVFRDRMNDYDSVDDLSGASSADISDALEDAELIEKMIGEASDEETRGRLKKLADETDSLLKGFLSGQGSASAGTAASVKSAMQFGPNEALQHDKSAFPSKTDPKWQDALANYGDPSFGWMDAGSGSTNPHYIDFGGRRYYVKKAKFGKSTYDKSAARNEANANNFLRLAGIQAPDSMYLKSDDGGRFCITAEADVSGGQLDRHLAGSNGNGKVKDQVKASYPVMALLYNMDVLQNSDNAFVDGKGNAVFLDNGSTFGFSAQGERNKYFDFDTRDDPENGNPDYLALANFKGNVSGGNWRKAFSGDSNRDVLLEDALREAAKYDMGRLVKEAQRLGLLKQLPKGGVDSLQRYADALDRMSAKYKAAPSAPVQTAPAASAKSVPVVAVPSSAGSGTLSPQAVSRLKSMMSRKGVTNDLMSAYQAMLQRGTPSSSTSASPYVSSVRNGKYANAIARLQTMASRPGASASQKAAYKAMSARLSGVPNQ